ncbi:hypothetical protein [Microbacterium rhizomatis]|uniref:Uncharacterized protein n=1 Tax=Microbacterium rhizomatis TaxID=1631477 RepID=A0A5J5J2M8_9MICO|nr:hypothetical protein [Microbacterium rhizomatis]KAA9108294.1 hypothetical protein F6B43_12935 [Microbacterium rhizomatis]
MIPLQKLLWAASERAFLEQGSSLLVGPAVRIGDALQWRTAGEVLTAYGFDAAGAGTVDVLRFERSPLTDVSIPRPGDPSWSAGYGTGFLRGPGAVPVWNVAATVMPRDAEIWRIHADGQQEFVAGYGGPAVGWRDTGVFVPPTMLVGPRAEWQGREYVATWVDATHIELVTLSRETLDGFTQTRPFVFSRVVEAASCSRLFENSFTGTWQGIPCTLVQSNQDEAAILLSTDAARAAQMGAVELEPGIYWHLVPRAEITDIQGLTRQLPPPTNA